MQSGADHISVCENFKEDSIDGFAIDKVRDTQVGGRYIEKVAFQETVTDPFGDEQVFDRVIYRQTEFNLFSMYPNIELWDAPRSTQAYVTRLLEFSNFAVTISPLSVDLVKWADNFQASNRAQIIIDLIQISGLEIERGISAKITVTGDKDVRLALQQLAKNRKYQLEKLQLRFFRDAKPVAIQLGSTGAVKIDEDQIEELLPSLRETLPRMKS